MPETPIKFLDADGTKALIERIAAMRCALDNADKSLESKTNTIKEQVDELKASLADSIPLDEIEALFV